ncbi:hypothetical protein A2797_02545 [candidate division WWE3 bacterium RIFCSPHIGHO2_01_FULL_48_15]|uniref:Uncharacterized protein n=1 Tax=candidate division WWE3 bacterium RIFCSPHIGHO2_01_FULL_48_15 TaxID=1802619 RepID=A0A1F4VA62_UNCKA|nr:MAG: hypothetical protein A2797_02545 [candidate division WWE3 bacterium RIFCSPHIGHO2_01_FULL_48_15]
MIPEVADLRTGTPLTVWVFWEDGKESSHVLERADHSVGVPVYHTVCGLTFRWGQDETGPFLLWHGWYIFKLSSDCEACIARLERSRGAELGPLPKGVTRYIGGKFVEVTGKSTKDESNIA